MKTLTAIETAQQLQDKIFNLHKKHIPVGAIRMPRMAMNHLLDIKRQLTGIHFWDMYDRKHEKEELVEKFMGVPIRRDRKMAEGTIEILGRLDEVIDKIEGVPE